MTLLALAAAAVPCLVWTQPVETAATLKTAGLTHLCAPAASAAGWRAAGFTVAALDAADLEKRKKVSSPGIRARADRASATRSPWVDTNGWEFRRAPKAAYRYELPAGRAALAAAEAFAYGVDAAVAADAADLAELGRMQAFLAQVPPASLPEVADLGVVDDGSAVMGEVLNLLNRRNLLYSAVPAGSRKFPVTVFVGPGGSTPEEVEDPSEFALSVRRRLGDAKRSLRFFGSEAVIGRLTAAGGRARLHLLNYTGRELEGLRVRVRGGYTAVRPLVAGVGALEVADRVVADGFTEFTLPRLPVYAVIDLGPSS